MADSPRIEELKRRVQQDPASIAFAALADEYRRAGRFQDAVETCRAGLLRHPAYLSARVTLGRALLEIGEFDEAEAELQQVLRTAPENLAAIRALAEIHHRRDDVPDRVPDVPALDAALSERSEPKGPALSERESTEPALSATEPALSATEPALSATEPALSATEPALTATEPALSERSEPKGGSKRLKETPAPADTPATAVSTVVPFAAPAPTATPPPAVTSTGSARVSQDPAVARLERFLAAIQRARRELDSEINAGR